MDDSKFEQAAERMRVWQAAIISAHSLYSDALMEIVLVDSLEQAQEIATTALVSGTVGWSEYASLVGKHNSENATKETET